MVIFKTKVPNCQCAGRFSTSPTEMSLEPKFYVIFTILDTAVLATEAIANASQGQLLFFDTTWYGPYQLQYQCWQSKSKCMPK